MRPERVIAVRSARVALGWTQVEFAEIVGMSRTTVARFETFECTLSEKRFNEVVKTLKSHGVDMDLTDGVKLSVNANAVKRASDRLSGGGR